ncbi:MAG: L,D-transpeptidase [Bacteroidia bacterium]|nr:L,D-transpeptidase [Bacteroidia bacterium]NND10184.1 L,D-transpeptidase [Flavobacteriaceae bacterium]NNK29162.1 L,D-transpeptidase [Flavobacteriaceae bacterium]
MITQKSFILSKTLLLSVTFLFFTYAIIGQITIEKRSENELTITEFVKIKRNIKVESYFQFMDSIAKACDSITPYPLTEHILVQANPWIIDTLQNTDYYLMKERDSFVYDQKKMVVLREGSRLRVPDSLHAKNIIDSFKKTRIDINIPEFKLRILQDSIVIHEFPVRVGRNEEKYLEMSERIEDLKTRTGKGRIVAYVKDPEYRNPVDNKQYFLTKRDDGKYTKLPQIPFIETEINGLRYGQLIHPTTNPETLGKAYSNGCIGTNESDAWVIYYFAPINTRITIRYDLNVLGENGEKIKLKDIYQYRD